MVIIPITCALFLNLLHERSRTVKVISIIVALALPTVPLLANYGVQYFGGYPPLAQNPTIATGLPALITGTALNIFHPAITYVYGSAQKIMIFILGFVALVCNIYISLRGKKTFRSLCILDVDGNSINNGHAYYQMIYSIYMSSLR